jgi:hypothetical protein
MQVLDVIHVPKSRPHLPIGSTFVSLAIGRTFPKDAPVLTSLVIRLSHVHNNNPRTRFTCPRDAFQTARLPAELRNKIYHLGLYERRPVAISKTIANPEAALLRTCKQIRHEALLLFPQINDFTFITDLRHCERWPIGSNKLLTKSSASSQAFPCTSRTQHLWKILETTQVLTAAMATEQVTRP